MPWLLNGVNDTDIVYAKSFELGQNVLLRHKVATDVSAGMYIGNGRCSLSLSPQQQVLAQGYTSGSNNMHIYSDPVNATGRRQPAASFSGSVYTTDCNDIYVAFGGSSPFLYVFDVATLSLQSVPTTGLSEVRNVRFSPNGVYMAVACSGSPYLRIYKTEDWSYYNAPSTAARYGCEFSADSTKLVTVGNNPYAEVFTISPTEAVRIATQTSSAYNGPASSGGSRTICRSSSNGNELIFCTNNASTGLVAKVNVDTLTWSKSPVVSSSGSQYTYGMVADPIAGSNLIAVNHYAISFGGGPTRGMTFLNADTLELHELMLVQSQDVAMHQLISNTSAAGSFYIINNTQSEVTGTVRDIDNSPAARKVRAFRRTDGALCAETISDAATGDYRLVLSDNQEYDVQFQVAEGEMLNDLIYARVEPKLL